VTVSRNVPLSAPNYTFCVEPAGREQKSADVEWKTVTLIYPYPLLFNFKSFLPRSSAVVTVPLPLATSNQECDLEKSGNGTN